MPVKLPFFVAPYLMPHCHSRFVQTFSGKIFDYRIIGRFPLQKESSYSIEKLQTRELVIPDIHGA